MRKLSIALVTVCLLACGGPADPVGADATAELSAAVDVDTPRPSAPKPARIAPAPPTPEAGNDPARYKTVHGYTKMFYEGQIDLLYERFSEGMVESFPLEQLSTLYEQVGQLYGKEVSVLGEETETKNDYRGFVRWARFDKTEDIIEVQWILNDKDEIAGFFVRPAQRKMTSKAVPVETTK